MEVMTKKEILEMWANDLEQNPDLQGKFSLRATRLGKDEYCCLGRLCELYHKATGKGEWQPYTLTITTKNYKFVTDTDEDDAVLPREVYEWAGLVADPMLYAESLEHGVTLSRSASGLNDDGFTFAQIAQFIRDNLIKPLEAKDGQAT